MKTEKALMAAAYGSTRRMCIFCETIRHFISAVAFASVQQGSHAEVEGMPADGAEFWMQRRRESDLAPQWSASGQDAWLLPRCGTSSLTPN